MKRFTLWAALFCVIGNKASAQVYEFSSQDYDIEKPEGNLIKTNYEVTYHIFDFTQKQYLLKLQIQKVKGLLLNMTCKVFIRNQGYLQKHG